MANLTISQLTRTADGEFVEVRGYLVIDTVDGKQYLCEELLESFPPQCGGKRILLRNFSWRGFNNLREDDGILWVSEEVTIRGVLDGGALLVQNGTEPDPVQSSPEDW